MEQISKMAIEVNKLIGGKLLAGKSIFLPQIGSLYITMTASQRKRVEFSSSEQGDSIVDVIIARAKCSDAEGETIYQRYLEEVRQGSHLSIMGVGDLRAKSFSTDESFSKQLNSTPVSPVVVPVVAPAVEPTPAVAPTPAPTPVPAPEPLPEPASPIARQTIQPVAEAPKHLTPSAETEPAPMDEPQPTEKRKGGKRAIVIILVLLAIAAAVYLLRDCQGKEEESPKSAQSSEQVTTQKSESQEDVAEEPTSEESTSKKEEAKAKVKEAEKQTPKSEQTASTSLRYRVVYGVFSSQANIKRAIRDINAKFGDDSAHTYRFGNYTMVSMFESNDRQECQRFLMRNLEQYPDTWVHERK